MNKEERSFLSTSFASIVKAAEEGGQDSRRHIYMNALKWANAGETKGEILKKLNEIIKSNESGDIERVTACENLKTIMRSKCI